MNIEAPDISAHVCFAAAEMKRLTRSFAHLKFPENRKQLGILLHPTSLRIRLILFDLKVLFTYFIIDWIF